MIKNDAPIFGRILTAMVTPFNDDLSIDYKAVDAIVEHLIKTGTDTIVVSGTTGESPTLEDDEKEQLTRAVIQASEGRAKVILGAGANATAKTIQLCQKAEELGVDGVLVVAPYYNKPGQAGLLAHYEEVLKKTQLPVMIYNIPGRTGININVETLLDLQKQFPHLHAVKDSTGNVDQAAEIACHASDHFRVYSGDDFLTLPFLSIGACGVVSVASHIVGSQIKKMVELFLAGDIDQARKIHYKLLPIFHGLFTAPNPTPVKHALSRISLCKPHVRLPMVTLNQHQKDILDVLLKERSILESHTYARATT